MDRSEPSDESEGSDLITVKLITTTDLDLKVKMKGTQYTTNKRMRWKTKEKQQRQLDLRSNGLGSRSVRFEEQTGFGENRFKGGEYIYVILVFYFISLKPFSL